jgi:hypothetical protein
MATVTLLQTVTKTMSAASGTPTSSSNRAPNQAGVLDKGNPAHFDAKNPIALFIIQVHIDPFSSHIRSPFPFPIRHPTPSR